MNCGEGGGIESSRVCATKLHIGSLCSLFWFFLVLDPNHGWCKDRLKKKLRKESEREREKERGEKKILYERRDILLLSFSSVLFVLPACLVVYRFQSFVPIEKSASQSPRLEEYGAKVNVDEVKRICVQSLNKIHQLLQWVFKFYSILLLMKNNREFFFI